MRKLYFYFTLSILLSPFYSYAIQPHLAYYKITLGSMKNNAKIISINGKSIYHLEESCLGWKTIEDFAIIFEFENGSNSKLISNWTTFETFSGEAFEFELNEIINDEEEKFFGFANLFSNGGFANYISDTEKQVSLSDKVIFPMQHLIKLIDNAKRDKKIFNSEIFLGSEVGQGYRIVTAILGDKKTDNNSLSLNNVNLNNYWPVSFAYFDPLSSSGKPEYEMYAKLHEDGIITNFEIDYGSFTINAELQKIEPIPISKCN